MQEFKDYYRELYNDIPENFSKFGQFGKGVYQDMVTEGLTTSYPIHKVLDFIRDPKNSRGFDLSDTPSVWDNNIEMVVNPRDGKVNRIVTDLNQKLSVFGYFVGKVGKWSDWVGGHKLIIEPKYPTKLSNEERMDAPFYHITHEKYMDKIQKIGLSPRNSTTMFSHPGGRVYLIQTNDHSILTELAYMLSSSKEVKNPRPQDYTEDKVVYLQIEVPPEMVLYNDPMFGESKDFNAVFTTQNIPPQNIKQVSIN